MRTKEQKERYAATERAKLIASPELQKKKSDYNKQYRREHLVELTENNKRWREENTDRIKELNKAWREKNPERKRELDRESRARCPYITTDEQKKRYAETVHQKRESPDVRAVISDRQKEWRKKNPHYGQNRYQNEVQFAMSCRLRSRLRSALKAKGIRKTETMLTLVGCSLPEIRLHIEKQFKEGMTWDNRDEWHIDHIIEINQFDLTDEEQRKKCFHFSNLRPLWWWENLSRPNRSVNPINT